MSVILGELGIKIFLSLLYTLPKCSTKKLTISSTMLKFCLLIPLQIDLKQSN